jgi:lysophospholipase L1-like esterase
VKLPFKISNIRSSCILLFSLLLPVIGGSTAVFAQGVTNVVAAASDVSHYPNNPSILPGKGPAATWSGLPEVWAERHAEWARTTDRDKGAVVFLGDSITQGWNSLARDFPDLHVANRGIGGDTTRGVLYRLKDDVLELDPKAIVLLIGTNDIGNGAKPEDVADNLGTILQDIRKSSSRIPIIVCRVMPRSDQNLRFVNNIKKLNQMIDALAKNRADIVECDTWSLFAEPDGGCQREDFHADLLHLNSKGYKKWAAALKPIFAKLRLSTAS